MQSIEALSEVENAYVGMVKRVEAYYGAYVDTMWSVVVLHTQLALGRELPLWSDEMLRLEDVFTDHIESEKMLLTASDRTMGLILREALDELHGDVEHELMVELLARRTMTVAVAQKLRFWSDYRLGRHASLRKQTRYLLDIAQFYLSDAIAKHEREMPEVFEVVMDGFGFMSTVHPNVITY